MTQKNALACSEITREKFNLGAENQMWAFSSIERFHVTAAMSVYQNKVTAAILVYQANPLGSELYFYAFQIRSFASLIKQNGRWLRE